MSLLPRGCSMPCRRMSVSLYTIPQLQTEKYDQSLTRGMTCPLANELSYILHVRADIAFPKGLGEYRNRAWNLGTCGPTAHTRKISRRLEPLSRALIMLGSTRDNHTALPCSPTPRRAVQTNRRASSVRRAAKDLGGGVAEAGRKMPSSAQRPGSRGCRSQWVRSVGARGCDCGREWEV